MAWGGRMRKRMRRGMSSSSNPPPEPFYTLRPHAGDITTVEYLNLCRSGGIASGTGNGQLSVWDLSSKRQIWTEVCPAGITSISNVQTTLLSVQMRGGVVKLWSLETQKPITTLNIQNPSFCRLSHFISSKTDCHDLGTFDAQCFAVADSNYGRVNIYDYKTQQLVQTLTAESVKSRGMCMCVRAWCDQTTGIPYVLAGFDDGSVLLWEARQPNSELTALKLYSEPVMCLGYDEERLCGVCGSPSNKLEAFSISDKMDVLEKKYSVELKNAGVADVSIRHDSKIMASGGWDGRVRVFGWKKGKPLAILNYHSAAIHCVRFAGHRALPDDSNLMMCGSKDSRISLWKLY